MKDNKYPQFPTEPETVSINIRKDGYIQKYRLLKDSTDKTAQFIIRINSILKSKDFECIWGDIHLPQIKLSIYHNYHYLHYWFDILLISDNMGNFIDSLIDSIMYKFGKSEIFI